MPRLFHEAFRPVSFRRLTSLTKVTVAARSSAQRKSTDSLESQELCASQSVRSMTGACRQSSSKGETTRMCWHAAPRAKSCLRQCDSILRRHSQAFQRLTVCETGCAIQPCSIFFCASKSHFRPWQVSISGTEMFSPFRTALDVQATDSVPKTVSCRSSVAYSSPQGACAQAQPL